VEIKYNENKKSKIVVICKKFITDLQEAQLNSGLLIFISTCYYSNINNNVNFIL